LIALFNYLQQFEKDAQAFLERTSEPERKTAARQRLDAIRQIQRYCREVFTEIPAGPGLFDKKTGEEE
jgi:hypothetical protein